jgi:hypothetical protein
MVCIEKIVGYDLIIIVGSVGKGATAIAVP